MNWRMKLVGLILTLIMFFSVAAVGPLPAFAADQKTSQSQLASEQKKKPWYKSRTTKIVGGSAGAGAVVGALVGGGKGAAAGALVGGGGGYLYDRKTRKKK